MRKMISFLGILLGSWVCYGASISEKPIISNNIIPDNITSNNVVLNNVALNKEEPAKDSTAVSANSNIPIAGSLNSIQTDISKTEAPKVFNKNPNMTLRIAGIQDIFKNQNLLGVIGLDNNTANLFLLSVYPQIGKDCSAFQKNTHIAFFSFKNLKGEDFQCSVFKLEEGNNNFNDFLKNNKFSFTTHKSYTISTGKQENLDLLIREKDLLETLVKLTQEPLESESIEINLSAPKDQSSLWTKLLSSATLKSKVLDHVKGFNITLQFKVTSVNVRIATLFESTFPAYPYLKSEYYKEHLGLGEYVEAKDAAAVFGLQDVSGILDSVIIPVIADFLRQNKNMAVFEKLLDSARSLLVPHAMQITTTFQDKQVSFYSYIIQQTTIEQHLESLKAFYSQYDNAFQTFFSPQVPNNTPLNAKTNNTPVNVPTSVSSPTMKFDYQLSSDYKGYKIYACTTTSNLENAGKVSPNAIGGAVETPIKPELTGPSVDKNSETKNPQTAGVDGAKTATKETSATLTFNSTFYMTLSGNQILGSDSLDYLKALIDNSIAKKLPAMSIESYLGGFPRGTLVKAKANLGKTLTTWLSKILEISTKVPTPSGSAVVNTKNVNAPTSGESNAPNLLGGFLTEISKAVNEILAKTKDSGTIMIDASAKNDRLQLELSLDYSSIKILIEIFQAIFPIIQKQGNQLRTQNEKVHNVMVPAKPVEEKRPSFNPVKTNPVFNP